LDLDDCAWGAGPLWDRGNVITEGSVVERVDEDTKENGCVFVRVRLELGVDMDDECGSNSREQTGL